VLHADAGTFVYTAQDQGRFYVVTPRGVVAELSGVQWNPSISEDGSKARFFATSDSELRLKVIALR
jgi:hypothetical protein